MLTPIQRDALGRIAQASVDSERATGMPAELTAAQCIFESSWLSVCPGNNAFGIKSDAHGSGVRYCLTHEYLNGAWQTMPQAFETYDSLADCFADHARLLQQGIYAGAWASYQQNHDLNTFTVLIAAHYASDPSYASKIRQEMYAPDVQAAIQQARQEAA